MFKGRIIGVYRICDTWFLRYGREYICTREAEI